MRPPERYGRQAHRPAIIPLTDVAKVWKPVVPILGGVGSLVAYTVGHTLYEDMPHTLHARGIKQVSNVGDDARSFKCMWWLAKTLLPVWVRPWVTYNDPHNADTYLHLLDVLDEAASTLTISLTLQELYMLDFPKEVATLDLHYAQRLGVRAFYQGALLGSTDLHLPSTTAVGLFLMAQHTMEEAPLLRIEATQSTALTLFDELLLEDQHA